ncbi:MAG: VCBS repeat-containing protein, partial [Saprospiraceae bacterium]
INKDGWIDLYVSNDYLSNDILYQNNGGKFENVIDKVIKHQSRFSMGNDIADINNDGEPDIITLDMLPEDNLRKKTVMGGNGYINYINDRRFGYTHQYTRNMLQVNNGDGTFSEVGMLAGIYQTEWSWSPLFIDLDNDGYRDLLITNGFPKDITDKDFVNFRTNFGSYTDKKTLLSEVPSVKVKNYIYRNNGDLTFKDMSEAWGIDNVSFSNGAAFADLDNDGDLDYIVNNINDPASIYENTLYTPSKNLDTLNHYLELTLEGGPGNSLGLGAKVWIKYGDNQLQYHDHSIYRGYISSVDPVVHFGLGQAGQVDSVLVVWPDRTTQLLTDVTSNQRLNLEQAQAGQGTIHSLRPAKQAPRLFARMDRQLGVAYQQPMYDFIDFNIQRNIPHKFTENGPALAIGDVNGDGLEDFITGNYKNQNMMLFLQQHTGGFREQVLIPGDQKPQVDGGLLLLDVDGDRDLDLYVVSGGFADSVGSMNYQDRLYINNGKGVFSENPDALPDLTASGLVVRAADADGDGDPDLFVGARVLPGSYPLPDRSYLLENDHGTFRDVTREWAPELSTVGMVTDAVWSDYNGDHVPDLIIVGEFMPIEIFKNTGQKLERVEHTGLEQYSGWWNSIVSGDFDRDGDMDYAVGNLGDNNTYHVSAEHPLKAYALDIDNNNSQDVILACYLKMPDGHYDLCPVNQWEELFSQSPVFRKRFSYHREFGMATIDSILTPEELERATERVTNYVLSSIIINQGDGTFRMEALPLLAQVAPVNGMVVSDVNEDAVPDLILVGNDYSNEVFSGTLDAMNGLVLLGKGDGHFDAIPGDCGFRVPGDAKALGRLTMSGYDVLIATQNKDSLMIFKRTDEPETIQVFTPNANDLDALITYQDGANERIEFLYGEGFLTQSSRRLRITPLMKSVVVTDRQGKQRMIYDNGMSTK